MNSAHVCGRTEKDVVGETEGTERALRDKELRRRETEGWAPGRNTNPWLDAVLITIWRRMREMNLTDRFPSQNHYEPCTKYSSY